MLQLKSDTTWIKQGRQKSAVARALGRPMTPSQIWRVARLWNHHIQLRDVSFILRQYQGRGLIRCFTRREPTGKVYYWSDQGRAVVEAAFGVTLHAAPGGINWRKYSAVARSRMRRLILLELAQERPNKDRAKTASGLRQQLKEKYPVSLNFVVRALRELRSLKFITVRGEGAKRGQKLYRLTPAGKRITALLMDESGHGRQNHTCGPLKTQVAGHVAGM